MLFTIVHLPFIVYHLLLLFTIYHLSFTVYIYHLSFTIHSAIDHLPLKVYHLLLLLPFTVYLSPFTVFHLPFIVHHLLLHFPIYCLSFAVFWFTVITRELLNRKTTVRLSVQFSCLYLLTILISKNSENLYF